MIETHTQPARYLMMRDAFYVDSTQYVELIFDDILDYMDESVRDEIFKILKVGKVGFD